MKQGTGESLLSLAGSSSEGDSTNKLTTLLGNVDEKVRGPTRVHTTSSSCTCVDRANINSTCSLQCQSFVCLSRAVKETQCFQRKLLSQGRFLCASVSAGSTDYVLCCFGPAVLLCYVVLLQTDGIVIINAAGIIMMVNTVSGRQQWKQQLLQQQ